MIKLIRLLLLLFIVLFTSNAYSQKILLGTNGRRISSDTLYPNSTIENGKYGDTLFYKISDRQYGIKTILKGYNMVSSVDSFTIEYSVGNERTITIDTLNKRVLIPTGAVFELYNTVATGGSYERIRAYWDTNVAKISVQRDGSGVARPLQFSANLSTFTVGLENNAFSRLIHNNSSGSTKSSLIIGGTESSNFANHNGLYLNKNLNQSANAAYKLLYGTLYRGTVGSGAKFFMDFGNTSGVDGTGSYERRFAVTDTGSVYIYNVPIVPNKSSYSHIGVYDASGILKKISKDSIDAKISALPSSVVFIDLLTGLPTGDTSFMRVNSTDKKLVFPIGAGWESYKTASRTTNFERLRHYWDTTVAMFQTELNGVGFQNQIGFKGTFGGAMLIGYTEDGPAAYSKVFANNPSGTSRSTFAINGNQTSDFAGNHSYLGIFPNIQQSGTAGYKGIWISSYEQSVGSAGKYHIDAGTNTLPDGKGTYTRGFAVTSANGRIYSNGRTTLTNPTHLIADSSGWESKTPIVNIVSQGSVVVSSAGTYNFSTLSTDYIFSGSTSTWTLPVISGNTGRIIYIKNRGSGNITLNSNAGGNDLYNSSAVNTLAVTPGTGLKLINDGTYWIIYTL